MQRLTKVTGVVLAGGRGSRMGGNDKGLAPLNGQPLFQHVLMVLKPQVGDVVISANRNLEIYRKSGAQVIQDAIADYQGPLAGMLAVMEQTESEWLLFCPCDTPNIPADLACKLWQARGNALAIWANDGQRDHPGVAMLHHSLCLPLREYLLAGERRVMQFLLSVGGHSVSFDGQATCFTNINTLDELSRWQKNE
ncbi:molybdopterin-guanine dinucleotide biosynthesis protein MobA [Cedecea neteri]|uniref:Molybdenum cofactor guanylyltransferase n=1 Tax=Cedecea neteri TaxID=158822 RepID=A0A2X2TD62_9ENTR|nr:molybdenum cofactor guanylyltransferase MobA [Cedecea neteri]SQA98543.1 molybdopterin-guanine dinucleotide biosynthesis protein MobA [Cedecea neteri]